MGTRQSAAPTYPVPAPASIDRRALEAYATWLFYERRILCKELFPGLKHADAFVSDGGAEEFHFGAFGEKPWNERAMPSSRAEGMLARLGIDWSKHQHKDLGPNLASGLEPKPVEPGFPHPDAGLLALEKRHRDLCAELIRQIDHDQNADAVDRELQALGREACKSVARSMLGLQSKAQMLLRELGGGELIGKQVPDDLDDLDRLAWSICSDLLGLTSPVQQAIADMAEGRA